MKEALKYLQAGAIVPVDMETTILLVNALKEALAQPAQDKLQCQCSMTTRLVGSGCQYCNPEYMDDDDDDTQVYKDHGDALTIAYQSGYYDGKKAAQRPLVGLTDADWKEIEDMPDTFDQGVAWCLARLKRNNT